MEGTLGCNKELVSENGAVYQVKELLGSGGQGEVYKVYSDGHYYALKWYFKHMATDNQKNILYNLIEKGSPDKMFLWPQDMIIEDAFFGYIMPLRPQNYKSIVDMMKRKAEPTFRVLCKAAYNLTVGYQKLHSKGYSYRDISFGNVFFNPESGEVLICDNDNVSVNGDNTSTVYGTPRFMAPEIVTGKSKPSTDTDLYSMAILLFYMFMLHHPLEGKREASIKCLDIHAMNSLYGTNPVFIFDPVDKSNKALVGYHDNALIYWDLYPKYFKDLFTKSFTEGINYPTKRIVEREWQEAIAKLRTHIIYCDKCSMESFYDEEKEKNNAGHVCWSCQSIINLPKRLIIGHNQLMLNKGFVLLSHDVERDFNLNKIIGTVVSNPTNERLLGLKNESSSQWTYIKTDGTKVQVPIGKTVPIIKGTKVEINNKIGEFA